MILVTGGAGFIGSNFVLSWLSDPNKEGIVNLDSLTYAGNLSNLNSIKNDFRHIFIKGDIGDYDLVLSILRQYQINAVVNFAAESHVDRSITKPSDFISTNVMGTFALLEAVRSYLNNLPRAEKDAFRLLHVSTDEVYGSLSEAEEAFVEEDCFLPNSPYSASKAASDHLVRAWFHTYGVPTLTTNCSNNYGPYQFPEKLIPLTILNAIAGRDLPIYGDGLQVRDWLYVRDHCRAICQVLESGKVGQTYNIGANGEKTNIEVVGMICDVLDTLRPKRIGSYSDQISFVSDRPGHDRRYAINSTKLFHELGWVAEESFESGIYKTVKWYLDNENWMENIVSGFYRCIDENK